MAKIDRLFDVLLQRGGSDLHLAVGYPPTLRVKGELVRVSQTPLTHRELDELLGEICDAERYTGFKEAKDLDFAYAYEDKARFRANYFWKWSGPAAVFRTIPSKILTAEQLDLPAAVVGLARRRSGLVLVTGPTGSGKSTTLAAMVHEINASRAGHILTIEDPVEFVHQPISCQITHREVGLDTPSFADAIRSAGRENADVILVGELRGQETMRLALQLASFGCLVFATVHTNSAPATIDRFINAFPHAQQSQIRGMLADALAGIVAQQLLKRADGTGRVAAHEILIANAGVASTIREAKTNMIVNLIQSGAQVGMQTMDAALERLLKSGMVTARDAVEKANDKEYFSRLPEVAAALGEEAAV
ncbi:MAG: PilT/PilU family type 4a pilus ATPase [Polyangiaceae bacterium]|nr:PilT/PilU family type 4a pilus ATPase [Polyangiaceae bacterium]MCW5789447.1 PilT/PilU family type 4a pilus ATPase [Polyangiaceae bacterium]